MSGLNPFPEQQGGKKEHTIEVILDSLMTQDGTGLSKDEDSFVYAENLAIARMLADLWSSATRLSYQFDPDRMTSFIPRWLKILGLSSYPGESLNSLRTKIKTKMQLDGQVANTTAVYDLCSALLGEVFVGLVHNSARDGYVSYLPGGLTVSGGGQVVLDGDWRSHINYVAVQVYQPLGMTDDDYYSRIGSLGPVLDDFLPAHVKWDWINSDQGFELDEINLDNSPLTNDKT